jgi:glycosyltransferase involved in cell wall biosynthesis
MRVSVVIPWGRTEDDVRRAALSAAGQTRVPVEVIVVPNYGVTVTEARERLGDLAGDGVVVVDGSGCANANGARNLGVRRSSGEWVAFLDSDDWWDKCWLETVASRHAELEGGADGFYGGIRVVDANGATVGVVPAHDVAAFRTPENYLLSYHSASSCTFVVRRALLESIPWSEALRRHQDYDLFVRLIAGGGRLRSVGGARVNVDWSAETRHRAHGDCFAVVRPWAGRVQPRFYYRHLVNLLRGAVRNRDPAALLIPFGFLNPKVWLWYLDRPRP